MPTVAPDGRTLRFRLKRNVVFHDGTPLRASHVAASLQRLGGSRASGWLLAMVDGASPGRAPAGIAATSDRTLEIRLKTQRARDLLALSLATPQAGVLRSGAKAAADVGTGPFELQGRAEGGLMLRANRDYFAGPPFLQTVLLLGPADRDEHIRRFQLGRAAGSLLGDSVYGERSPLGRVPVAGGPPAYLTCLVLNAERAPTSDARRRRAIGFALRRDRLADGDSRPAGLPGRAGPPAADLRRSRAELEAAGGLPGPPLVLLVDGDDPFGAAIAPLLQRDLAEAGITTEKVVLTGARARARLTSGSWHLRLVTLAPPSPDLVLQLGQILALGGLEAEAFRLLGQAGSDRAGEIDRAQRALESEAVVVPLLRRAPRLYHSPTVRGVGYDTLGLLRVPDLWLRTEPESGREGEPGTR